MCLKLQVRVLLEVEQALVLVCDQVDHKGSHVEALEHVVSGLYRDSNFFGEVVVHQVADRAHGQRLAIGYTQNTHPHPPHVHTPHDQIHSGPLVSSSSDQVQGLWTN